MEYKISANLEMMARIVADSRRLRKESEKIMKRINERNERLNEIREDIEVGRISEDDDSIAKGVATLIADNMVDVAALDNIRTKVSGYTTIMNMVHYAEVGGDLSDYED